MSSNEAVPMESKRSFAVTADTVVTPACLLSSCESSSQDEWQLRESRVQGNTSLEAGEQAGVKFAAVVCALESFLGAPRQACSQVD